jgi:hypothetical protein
MDFNCVALVLATYENLVRPDRRSKEEPPGTSAYSTCDRMYKYLVCTAGLALAEEGTGCLWLCRRDRSRKHCRCRPLEEGRSPSKNTRSSDNHCRDFLVKEYRVQGVSIRLKKTLTCYICISEVSFESVIGGNRILC